MKAFVFFWLFLFQCAITHAAFVVTGETDGLSPGEKFEIYQGLVSSSFPDIDDLNNRFNRRIKFVPNTAYHVLQSTRLKAKPDNQTTKGYAFTVEGSVKTYHHLYFYGPEQYSFYNTNSDIYKGPNRALFCQDFWDSNEHVKAQVKTKEKGSEDFIAAAADIIRTKSSPIKQGIPDVDFYKRIIDIENDAYAHQKVLLIRFTQGLGAAHPDLLDSILEMPLDVENPKRFKSGGKSITLMRCTGLSFSTNILDNYACEIAKVPEDLYTDLNYMNAPSSALFHCLYYCMQLEALKNLFPSQKVKDRINKLSGYTLYCLSIPQSEFQTLNRYIYDARHFAPFHGIMVGGHGDTNHSRIFTCPKGPDGVSPHEKFDEHTKHSDSSEEIATFIRTYYTWMAKHSHILYQNNKFTDGTPGLSHEVYRDFYTNTLPQVLKAFDDHKPLDPLPVALNRLIAPSVNRQEFLIIHTATQRLEELTTDKTLKSVGQEYGTLCRTRLLLTAHDPETGYNYGFRVKGPSATHAEKRTIISALVADVFYTYRETGRYVTPNTHRSVFTALEEEVYPVHNGDKALSYSIKGYDESDRGKIRDAFSGHQVMVRACLYAIASIFQNQPPQWEGKKARYFDDLYDPGELPLSHNGFIGFKALVLAKKHELEGLDHNSL